MAARTTEKDIEQLERTYWKAMQEGDVDATVRLTDFPALVTGAQGAMRIDRETFVRMSRDGTWKIRKVDLGELQVRVVNDDLAIVAYKVHEDLTVNDEPVSLDAADASVWIRRDGEWKCALHTESLLGDPFGRDRITSSRT
jgi:ketosteroid isomerase-like protein